jgi:hypothetical protein
LTVAADNTETPNKAIELSRHDDEQLLVGDVSISQDEASDSSEASKAWDLLSWLWSFNNVGWTGMVQAGRDLPPSAQVEQESSGQTAIGYARAVACLFLPCDIAARLFSSFSARVLVQEL